MAKTHFPQHAGQRWADSLYRPDRFTTGNVFYVSSGTGSSTGPGYSPETAFATIDQAVGACTANNGDLIYVLPGHTESVSAAGGLDLDVAGITIIGLGNGSLRPTITLDTANTADIDVDAANITIENLLFIANFLDIAAAIDVNADDFTMRNCECRDTSTILNAKIWVLGASGTTSDRTKVIGCRFNAFGDANTSCISLPGTPDGCEICDNILIGDWGTAAILAAGAVTKAIVLRNLVSNLDAGDDVCINLAASSTGIIAYNGVGARETDASTDQITGGSTMTLIQNFAVDEGDRSGVLDPAAT